MKRDMDLVRTLLLEVEKHPAGFAPGEMKIEGYTSEQIGYHAHIMGQAGLVKAIDTTHMGSPGPEAVISSLTWQGHEFLDAAREPTRWQQAKDVVAKAGDASIQVWIAVLTDLVKKNLGLS
jgi:hypothetical protein